MKFNMLIEHPPTVKISVLVNSLKAVTSRQLRNRFLEVIMSLSSGHGLISRVRAKVRLWK